MSFKDWGREGWGGRRGSGIFKCGRVTQNVGGPVLIYREVEIFENSLKRDEYFPVKMGL